jgi:hypothetical protein
MVLNWAISSLYFRLRGNNNGTIWNVFAGLDDPVDNRVMSCCLPRQCFTFLGISNACAVIVFNDYRTLLGYNAFGLLECITHICLPIANENLFALEFVQYM